MATATPIDGNFMLQGRIGKIGWLIGLLALAVLVGGYLFIEDAKPDRADPNDQSLVSEGKVLYAEKCAECHGAQLQGEPGWPDWRVRKPDGSLPAPPHDETGHTWHHDDALLFDYTKRGGAAIAPAGFKSGMPGFGEVLSDRQVWAVLSFIKSTWPDHVIGRQESLNKRSK
ncbi:MAG: cytochrome c [Rhodospirillales bacterium]|nr:cytochrome c [Rhodospirillales bacterium]MCW8861250.1 cytochrome c [Rhodospirillales bacterium]